MRVMHNNSNRFGWSSDLVDVTDMFDIVRLVTSLVSQRIEFITLFCTLTLAGQIPHSFPRVIFYIIAHTLVLTAVADTVCPSSFIIRVDPIRPAILD